MATESGRPGAGVRVSLFGQPQQFDFYQAVRVLERLIRHGTEFTYRPRLPIGLDNPPEKEFVRFCVQPSLAFPTSPVSAVRAVKREGDIWPPLEMLVSFFGLLGPQGVMPHHYTVLALRRVREKDTSLRDWLDLFHHRLISLFYRAWEKSRLPFSYERTRLDKSEELDVWTQGLYCLTGMGTDGLRGRQAIDDEVFLYYAGLFSHRVRPALGLEGMLVDYFQVPVKVQQFHGRWLTLEPKDCSYLPSEERSEGINCLLGVDCIAGERIWDVQSMIRLRVGPLTGKQFIQLLPGTRGLKALSQLIRSYIGPELEFDVQLVLHRFDVPSCKLGDEEERSFLGWNTWLLSGECSVHDTDDAVFADAS